MLKDVPLETKSADAAGLGLAFDDFMRAFEAFKDTNDRRLAEVAGAVASVANARTFVASGLTAFADDFFARGLLTWTSGPNTGRTMEVKAHYKGIVGADTIELWRRMSEDIAVGNGFTVTAGCDKQFETCRVKFANGDNFRGFPHMPGNDYVTAYPNSGDSGNDGGSRFS